MFDALLVPIGALVATVAVWALIKGLRSGRMSVQTHTIIRSERPRLFWACASFNVFYLALGLYMVVIGLGR